MRNFIYSSLVNLVHSISSLYWVITAVGGIIIIALTYVSWIKYKQEKNKRKKKLNS